MAGTGAWLRPGRAVPPRRQAAGSLTPGRQPVRGQAHSGPAGPERGPGLAISPPNPKHRVREGGLAKRKPISYQYRHTAKGLARQGGRMASSRGCIQTGRMPSPEDVVPHIFDRLQRMEPGPDVAPGPGSPPGGIAGVLLTQMLAA